MAEKKKKNKRLHIGDEGYLDENPMRVYTSFRAGEAAARALKDLGVGGAKAVGQGAKKLRDLMEGELDKEDMSSLIKGQRESAIERRKKQAAQAAERRKTARAADARTRAAGEKRMTDMSGVKRHRGGGKVKMGYKKGGSVKAKSIDGIAQRGKTRAAHR